MRTSLAAVRQRIERLASTMAAARLDLSRLSDEELIAEGLACAAQLEPCPACGYDLAARSLAEWRATAQALTKGQARPSLSDPFTCPQCVRPNPNAITPAAERSDAAGCPNESRAVS
jgi:hypothetical protein